MDNSSQSANHNALLVASNSQPSCRPQELVTLIHACLFHVVCIHNTRSLPYAPTQVHTNKRMVQLKSRPEISPSSPRHVRAGAGAPYAWLGNPVHWHAPTNRLQGCKQPLHKMVLTEPKESRNPLTMIRPRLRGRARSGDSNSLA